MDYIKLQVENDEYIDIELLSDTIDDVKELQDDKLNIMKQAYIHNLNKTKLVLKENEMLKKYINNDIELQEIIQKYKTKEEKKEHNVKDLSLKLDITQLKNKLDNCEINQFNIHLDNIENNKTDTINMLIVKYLEEKQLIYKMHLEEQTNIFKNEYNLLTLKINYLINYRDNKVKEKNHLIYLQTESGNYSILKDIEIPSDYYEIFDDLFTSIENNEFKNNKIINKSNSSYDETFFEVKSSQARITYIKINNVYLILNSFIKKVQTSSLYRDNINNDINNYKRQKEHIISELNNNYNNFIEKNDEITKYIHKKLFITKKVK